MNNTATSITQVDVETLTRAWMCDTFLYMQANASLDSDEPLLSGGVIDSVGVIELVEFLQSSFGIVLADDEITEDNLGSLRAIGEFVARKCRSARESAGHPRQVA
jgi:acyl carrier protein